MALSLRLGLFLLLCATAGTSLLPRPALPAPQIAGRVLQAGTPSAGARVRYQATDIATVTDKNGRFQLPANLTAARITAAKEGSLIAGVSSRQRPLELSLLPLPKDDHEGYAWVDPTPNADQPANCGNCHPDLYREWAMSGHGRAGKNRHFLNLYEGTDWHGHAKVGWNLLADNPAGAGVCNACHAPTASFEADLRWLKGVDTQGVHCDFCHKVVGARTENLGRTHGRFGLELRRPATGQLFFGPLDDVDRGEDSFSPLYRDSRYCASCHEGTVFGVPVYTTYSEWLTSPARREGKQCQTCHMAPTGTLTNFAPGKGGLTRDPPTLASHRFPGGTPALLRRCLSVQVHLTPSTAGVRAEVEVTARDIGHRLPTGFVDRNVILVVEGLSANGQKTDILSGPRLSARAGAALTGQAGKIYAKQLKESQVDHPTPFWRADPEVTDTRLVPGQADTCSFTFAPQTTQVRVQLLYRRFWDETAQAKGWPDNEFLVLKRSYPVGSDH